VISWFVTVCVPELKTEREVQFFGGGAFENQIKKKRHKPFFFGFSFFLFFLYFQFLISAAG